MYERIGDDPAAASLGDDARDQFVAGCIEVIHGYARKAFLKRRQDNVDGVAGKGGVKIQLTAFFFGFLVEFVERFAFRRRAGGENRRSRPADRDGDEAQNKNCGSC